MLRRDDFHTAHYTALQDGLPLKDLKKTAGVKAGGAVELRSSAHVEQLGQARYSQVGDPARWGHLKGGEHDGQLTGQ